MSQRPIFLFRCEADEFYECIADVLTTLCLTLCVAFNGRTIVTMRVPASVLAGYQVPEFGAAIRAWKRFSGFRHVEEFA